MFDVTSGSSGVSESVSNMSNIWGNITPMSTPSPFQRDNTVPLAPNPRNPPSTVTSQDVKDHNVSNVILATNNNISPQRPKRSDIRTNRSYDVHGGDEIRVDRVIGVSHRRMVLNLSNDGSESPTFNSAGSPRFTSTRRNLNDMPVDVCIEVDDQLFLVEQT